VPERVGSKVLPIPTKSRLSLLTGQPEALGEEQEPPRMYAGEVSEGEPSRRKQYSDAPF
jgi:hypothetical protein